MHDPLPPSDAKNKLIFKFPSCRCLLLLWGAIHFQKKVPSDEGPTCSFAPVLTIIECGSICLAFMIHTFTCLYFSHKLPLVRGVSMDGEADRWSHRRTDGRTEAGRMDGWTHLLIEMREIDGERHTQAESSKSLERFPLVRCFPRWEK